MPSYTPFCPIDISVVPREAGLSKIKLMIHGRPALIVVESFLVDVLNLRDFIGGFDDVYTDVPPNPSVEAVASALSSLHIRPEVIIAIGGGSAIDLAKAVSALSWIAPGEATVDKVRSAIAEKRYAEPLIDIIAVPTTAGTGSEVTRWATVWDPEKKAKLSVEAPLLSPKAAVVIPEFTATMPERLTLATGLDALSHAMEAFWARSRTPLSGSLARSAIWQIRDALPNVLKNKENLALREKMCLGSLTAGMAFSLTRTTACHSISYPLTMLYHIPHGFAAALTLREVARKNAEVVPEIAEITDGFDQWFSEVTRDICTFSLQGFGVSEGDIPEIARLAFTQGRMDNNPVIFTPNDVCDILYACL